MNKFNSKLDKFSSNWISSIQMDEFKFNIF